MMIKKVSTTLCNESFEKREQFLQLRTRILQAEQERIHGAEGLDISEARKRLKERLDDVQC